MVSELAAQALCAIAIPYREWAMSYLPERESPFDTTPVMEAATATQLCIIVGSCFIRSYVVYCKFRPTAPGGLLIDVRTSTGQAAAMGIAWLSSIVIFLVMHFCTSLFCFRM
jgi:hypothetical protein